MTGDVLSKLIGTYRTNNLRDMTDKAIPMVAFALMTIKVGEVIRSWAFSRR